METKNKANTWEQLSQRYRNLGYTGMIALTLLTTSCKDDRTHEQIKADDYTEQVDKKQDLEKELQNYDNKLKQAQAKLQATQAQIQTTKEAIKAGNHTPEYAKTLKKLTKKEADLQKDISGYITDIQESEIQLDATRMTIEILGENL